MSKSFPSALFEPEHRKFAVEHSRCLQSKILSRMGASLVQNPVEGFRHTCKYTETCEVSLRGRGVRQKIVPGSASGEFGYIHKHLAAPAQVFTSVLGLSEIGIEVTGR